MENNNNFPEKAEDFFEEAPLEFEDLTAQTKTAAAEETFDAAIPDIGAEVIPDIVPETIPASKPAARPAGKPVKGDSIISVRNLSKSYGAKKVLDGVSFDL